MKGEYVRMCQMAKEIQGYKWSPKGEDRVLNKLSTDGKLQLESLSKGIETKEASVLLHQTYSIFLPRQEDLQILCTKDNPERFYSFDKLWDDFCAGWNVPPIGVHESFEEYWLLFYMEMCHGKTWNTENREWEEIK